MGAVFALFSAWYFWIPKILGLDYNRLLGKVHFWILFIGVKAKGIKLFWHKRNASVSTSKTVGKISNNDLLGTGGSPNENFFVFCFLIMFNKVKQLFIKN